MILLMDTIKSFFSEENKGKTITTILAIILVIAVGYFFFGKEAFAPSQKDLKAGSTATTSVDSVLTNSISTSNQTPSDLINIEKVVITKGSWIAIYSDNEGEPGSIIGAQYLTAGDYANVPVQIFVRTVAGQTYYAVVNSDDGVMSFDYKKDLPITNSEGKWVMDSFEVLPIGARG